MLVFSHRSWVYSIAYPRTHTQKAFFYTSGFCPTLNRKLAAIVKYQPFSFRFLSEDWGKFENGATWKVEEGIEKYDFREFLPRDIAITLQDVKC